LLDVFATIGTRALTEYTRAVERYVRLATGPSQQQDKGVATAVSRGFDDYLRDEYPLVAAVQAGVDCCDVAVRSWIDAGRRFAEKGNAKAGPVAATAPARAASSILFRGAAGTRVTNGFMVANTRQRPVEVSFAMTQLASDGKDARVSPTIRFTPATSTLAAGAEQVIECTLWLGEEFRPGVAYRGQIRVVEFPETAIAVSIQVDETNTPQDVTKTKSAAAPPARSSRKRKKR